MRTKYWIAAIFTAALLVAAAVWALDTGMAGGKPASAGTDAASSVQGGGKESGTSAASVVASPTLPAEKTSPSSIRDTSSTPSPSAVAGDAANATRPSWNPQPPPSETAGLEMPTATPGKSQGLPKSKVRKPAMSSVPEAGSAKGKLMPGFPTNAVPVPADSTITTSSISPHGKRVLVGLQGRSTTSPATVLEFYDHEFEARGWASSLNHPDTGVSILQTGFGNDSVVVTAQRLPTGQTAFAVAGVFKVNE